MNKSIKTTAFTLAEGATHVETCDSSNKTAFTLAEGATHVETCDSSRKAAFTLAEVMITLAIIGVVAVIVFPIFMQDMSERTNSHREANIAQKITKSVEVMSVNGDYENFTSTEDFVNHLKKYLKIVKVCDKDHLTDCWPAKVVTAADGNKYEVKNIKTGAQLHTNTETNTVGLVLADGANILLTYDPFVSAPSSEQNFIPYKKRLPIGKNKFEEFAYSSNATSAIDYVVDLNGSGGPNAEPDNDGKYFDIRSFRNAKFSNTEVSCEAKGGSKVGSVCVVDLGTNYNAVNCSGGQDSQYCGNHTLSLDYWAGAKKACSNIDMKVPSTGEWNALLTEDFDRFSNAKDYWSSNGYGSDSANTGNGWNQTFNGQKTGEVHNSGSKKLTLCIK